MRIVPEQRSDEELIAACNRGEAGEAQSAFNGIYERHRDYVFRVAMRFTEDREIAADALQEVFTWLLKQFPPPGPGVELRARLTTFLYPVAKNTTITLLRKARRFQPADIEPDELAESKDTGTDVDDLDRLLAGLPTERREILSLRFVDGLALEEIASALEIPVGTVKSRLHNAIKTLREHPAAKNFFEA